ncbi:uncharacterized protein LOC143548961 [Bidens hawaiensis]|uniref:uncharacterized protein LOC143548961 n=1 Tax=Bidens hawaiensis TaxID=980011 RepID=UPI00404B0257
MGDQQNNQVGGSSNQVGFLKEPSFFSIRFPILTTTNYTIWTVKIKAIFKVQGLLEAIKPRMGTVVDSKIEGLAIVYLYQGMPEALVMQVAHLSTAKDIWDALKTRFVGVDRVREARIESLQHEFDALKIKEMDTIDDFSTKISQIASKASNLGEPFEEKTLVRKLLKSIPRKRPTFHEAVGRLKAFEERSGDEDKLVSGKQEQLLYTYEEWKAKSNQERRHGKGKMGTESSQKNKGKGKGKVVDREKKEPPGHFATSCPNRNKETNDQSNLAQDGGTVLNMMTVARSKEDVVFLKEDRVDPKQYASTPCDKNTWILDNGASNHMTGNPEWFSNIDRNKTGKVSFGDGSCVEIEGRGTIVVEGQRGE